MPPIEIGGVCARPQTLDNLLIFILRREPCTAINPYDDDEARRLYPSPIMYLLMHLTVSELLPENKDYARKTDHDCLLEHQWRAGR